MPMGAPLRFTRETMRFIGSTNSSFHSPRSRGVEQPAGSIFVDSMNTRPAPPAANFARCERWKSLTCPPSAEYVSIGESTMRLRSVMPRILIGVNSAGCMALLNREHFVLHVNLDARGTAAFFHTGIHDMAHTYRTARVGDQDIRYDLADYTPPWSKTPAETLLLYHGYARNMSFW